jgi:hypothetical protein
MGIDIAKSKEKTLLEILRSGANKKGEWWMLLKYWSSK